VARRERAGQVGPDIEPHESEPIGTIGEPEWRPQRGWLRRFHVGPVSESVNQALPDTGARPLQRRAAATSGAPTNAAGRFRPSSEVVSQ